jgi:hypothetical protein
VFSTSELDYFMALLYDESMMKLAPIVLFVYNRPEHTLKTIEALKKNLLATESDLFVFADGPKVVGDEKVQAVREVIKNITGFATVTVQTSDVNKGLANSVIAGVSQVLQQYDRVIVLEDDIVTQRGFLTFMNQALSTYAHRDDIMSFGATTFALKGVKQGTSDVVLLKRNCSWGWGTWAKEWSDVDWEMTDYQSFLSNPKAVDRFNEAGPDLFGMLQAQMNGKIDSWAVRWQYHHFKKQKRVVNPLFCLASNIGMDGSGVHFTETIQDDYFRPLPLSDQITFNMPATLKGNAKADRQYYVHFAKLGVGRSVKARIKLWAKIMVKGVLKRIGLFDWAKKAYRSQGK